MICYLKHSGNPTRFSGGDRKSLLKMSSSWIHQDPLSYRRLLIYVHTSHMQNVHCPCPPYHFLNPPFHLSFSCPMMTSSPSSRVKVLWSKWGPGVDEFLELGPSLTENLWTKETRYLHTHTRHINTMLDRQSKTTNDIPVRKWGRWEVHDASHLSTAVIKSSWACTATSLNDSASWEWFSMVRGSGPQFLLSSFKPSFFFHNTETIHFWMFLLLSFCPL